jgi:integrase
MLATGARIGEILALRWEDLDLAAERPTLTICGTLVYVKGKDFFRQEWTKSDAGYRMIVLPRFAVGMLLARKLVASDNPNDAIFASRHDTWLSPNNVRRQWRQARAETSLEWGHPAHLPQDRRQAHRQGGRHQERRGPARARQPGGHRQVLHRQARPRPRRLRDPPTTWLRPRSRRSSTRTSQAEVDRTGVTGPATRATAANDSRG